MLKTRPDMSEEKVAARMELARECVARRREYSLGRIGTTYVVRRVDYAGPSEVRAAITRLCRRMGITPGNNHALLGMALIEAGLSPEDAVLYLDLTREQLDELLTMGESFKQFLECVAPSSQQEWFDRHPLEGPKQLDSPLHNPPVRTTFEDTDETEEERV